MIPAMASSGYRGGSYVATGGWIDPPRNVRGYSLAMQRVKVDLREGVACTGVRTRAGRKGHRIVTGVETTAGTISTDTVILTGGPLISHSRHGPAGIGHMRASARLVVPADAKVLRR